MDVNEMVKGILARAHAENNHFGDFATYNGERELCGRWLTLMLAFWTFTSLENDSPLIGTIRTRSGESRSAMAVPSARNSGLERIWKLMPLLMCVKIFSIASAVLTGTVDFSTTILSLLGSSKAEVLQGVFLMSNVAWSKAILLEWPIRYNIALGMAKGLSYLHSRGPTRLAHGDLKSSNILLDRNMEPKIADFGLARMCKNNERKVLTRIEGKRGYVAPEYARYGQLTPKADVFSFGIIALELVSGRESMNQKLPAEEQYLLSWAWNLYEQRRLMDLVDPKVREGCDEEQALLLIKVALLCSQGEASFLGSRKNPGTRKNLGKYKIIIFKFFEILKFVQINKTKQHFSV